MKHNNTYLAKAGLKVTQSRIALLSLLEKHNRPVDVPHLLSDLKEKAVTADQATVYRILDAFYKKGLIDRLDFGEGKFRYEVKGKDHHHFICEKCGWIEDLSECSIQDLEKDITQKKGFLIRHHSLEFFGVCNKCQH